MTTALYLGRFQPFHLGHLDVVKKVAKKYDNVVIAICSAQYSNTMRNPFSYVERWFMVDGSLKDEGISNYKILPIPDIHCYEKWAEFCNAIYGDYDVVITNNPNTRKLFENRGDKVEGIEPYKILNKVAISGTLIRDMIARGNPNWIDCVPLAVVHILCERNAEGRPGHKIK